jgi:aminopeptidase-like protein
VLLSVSRAFGKSLEWLLTGDSAQTRDKLSRSRQYVARHVPLEFDEIPGGTRVFDWTVPKEWTLRDGYVKNSRGERVIDCHRHTLHVC